MRGEMRRSKDFPPAVHSLLALTTVPVLAHRRAGSTDKASHSRGPRSTLRCLSFASWSCRGHLRNYALHDGGIAIHAAWAQQVLHFSGQLVNGRILGGETRQCDSELERNLKIRRTFSACMGENEVKRGYGPRRLDQWLHLIEESRRQAGHRIALSSYSLEKFLEQAGLLRGHAHALAIDGVEPADCVADGQQPARERVEALEMAPHALAEAVPRDVTQWLGMADRVVNGRCPQSPGIIQEAFGIAGWRVTVAPTDGRHPPVALKRQHQAATTIVRRAAESHDTLPIGRGVVRNGKDA